MLASCWGDTPQNCQSHLSLLSPVMRCDIECAMPSHSGANHNTMRTFMRLAEKPRMSASLMFPVRTLLSVDQVDARMCDCREAGSSRSCALSHLMGSACKRRFRRRWVRFSEEVTRVAVFDHVAKRLPAQDGRDQIGMLGGRHHFCNLLIRDMALGGLLADQQWTGLH